MNNLDLIITNEAYSDLIKIADYIAKDNVNSAIETVKILKEHCYLLTKFPNLGINRPSIKTFATKIFIVKKQFIIAYGIDNNNLVIFKIINIKQDVNQIL